MMLHDSENSITNNLEVKSKLDTKDHQSKKVPKNKRKIKYVTDDSTVHTAVKNVKKILEKKKLKKDSQENSNTAVVPTTKRKWIYKPKGHIVYIGHIPHGFYEEQFKKYFKQFGKVTRVRVVRSKKTGRSRGYGYVEFEDRDVAEIAASTMNNYLMCGRMLKTTYIPPKKQHMGFFFGKNWSKQKYHKVFTRKEAVRRKNSDTNDKAHNKSVKKVVKHIRTLEETLKANGINIDLSTLCTPNV